MLPSAWVRSNRATGYPGAHGGGGSLACFTLESYGIVLYLQVLHRLDVLHSSNEFELPILLDPTIYDT